MPTAFWLATAFDPVLLITGNGGFWRADKGVTQVSGSVSAWADQSSFANNLSFVSAKPTWSASGFNSSFAGISFTDGGSASLQATTSFSSATVTVFMLLFSNGNTGSGYVEMDSTATPGFAVFSAAPGFTLSSSGERGNGNSALVVSNNTISLYGGVFDGANANKWLNGTVQGSGTAFTSTLGNGGSDTIAVGAPLGGPTAAGATFAFVGLTYRAMNATDWTNLKNWSNANWGTSF